MGQDYTARKAAKKSRKRIGRDGAHAGDAKERRERKKKGQARRLCRYAWMAGFGWFRAAAAY